MTTAFPSPLDLAEREGYVAAPPRRPLRQRLRRGLPWILAVLGIVFLMWSALRGASSSEDQALSIANAQPEGAMAVAEILRHQGLDVREIPYLARARVSDPSSTTLAITFPGALADYQLESILKYPGDLVFVGVSEALIGSLGAGLDYVGYTASGLRRAACPDPDAIAAERIDTGGSGVSGGDGCFEDAYGAAAYVALDRDGRRIILLADPLLAMNEALAAEGHAALVLRALGRHEHLVWYTGSLDDATSLTWVGGPSGDPPGTVELAADYLPAGSGPAFLALCIAAGVAAVWKGRRFGPLVSEPLPVVVHASESTRGRGRLYRRARATGRASAALRAAAAERMGRRLGIPRTADPAALIAAIARATSREAVAVERLLYGPPPTTEQAMMDVAKELDALEREVHRP